MTTYEPEVLDDYHDNGTMPDNVAELADAVVGHRIVRVEDNSDAVDRWGWRSGAATIVLDNGKRVKLHNTHDCCAYTELDRFLLDPGRVDHIITGVGTTDEFTKWHIFADMGDVLELDVSWSAGNPFYYGYGFVIEVEEEDVKG